jgi:choline-sulfatase
VLCGLAAVPLYRVTRRIAAVIPAVGPAPRVVVLGVVAVVGVIGLAGVVMMRGLDWQALGLGSLIAIAALPLLAVAVVAMAPAAVRTRLRTAVVPVLVVAVAGVTLAVVMLRRAPSRDEEIAVVDKSLVGARIINVLRARFDRDHDGYSNFYGIKDCNDGDAKVNPAAKEIAGNGIDDNCEGGDRPKAAAGSADVAGVTPGSGSGSAAGAGSAGGPATPVAAGDAIAAGKNILFVMVDTVRADRVGVSGYKRDGKSLTPVLDAFATEAQTFTRAYAQSPNTPRSLPSMLASRFPSQITWDPSLAPNYPTVVDDNVLLFEVLHEAGLHTVGETSHFYFCDEELDPGKCAGFKKAKRSNVRQGAVEWNNEGVVDVEGSNHDTASPRLVPRALAKLGELAAAKTRFAMFLHLFEPHSTYMQHEGLTYSAQPGLAEKYEREIEFVDGWLGKLLDGLKAAGLDQNTVVAIVSDHGEAFGDHSANGKKVMFHGDTLYEDILRVPMMIRVPGLAGKQHDAVVQVIDLAPTLVDALGLARPPTWVGRSLVPTIRGQAQPAQPAYAEQLTQPNNPYERKAMITADGAWKLYYRISDKRYEMYDLRTDPGEQTDLWTSNTAQAELLKAQMTDWIEGPLAQ